MSARRVVIAAHGHCFDGLASATLFSHLRRELDPRPVQFKYLSCGYGPTMQTVPERWLSGDENAIVDFRYTPSPRLTWYFDHHVTAFASDAERDAALAGSERYFFDPSYGSCTKLIATVGEARFGVRSDAYAKLVEWADRIDSASFSSAAEAIDRHHPIMQLASVVEQHGDAELLGKLVAQLLDGEPEDVARSAEVQALWLPIEQAHAACQARIRQVLVRHGSVVVTDLHDAPLPASGKFVSYALAPECVYTISLVRMKNHYKVTVGYNPWCGVPRHHDIAALCRRWGGGGHPVVGAVSVPLAKLDQAHDIVATLVTELNR